MRKQKRQQEVKGTGQTLIHEDIRESGHEENKEMKAQIICFQSIHGVRQMLNYTAVGLFRGKSANKSNK